MDMGWFIDNNHFDDSTKVLESGLYYTTEDIVLSGSSIIGNGVTFVSRNTISFSGSEQNLQPYVDGLLAFTDKKYSNADDQCVKFV